MKKLFILMLCTCSGVYAESRVLPPVIDNSSYPGGSAYSATPSSNNSMYEVLSRLEQLQQEIQQLRGVVEEQSQTIIDLKKRQRNIYSDLDLRLQTLTGGDVQNYSNFDSNDQAGEFVENNEQSNNSVTEPTIIESPDTIIENSNMTDEIVNGAPVRNEKKVYHEAYELLRNGHNTRAISAFKSFLTEFPNSGYADNAQYWLGEAYMVNQDLNSSKIAFTKVISLYTESPKIPDALLKLAYLELKQKNMAKARDYLTQVSVSHPNSTAAHLAKKKLLQMERKLH